MRSLIISIVFLVLAFSSFAQKHKVVVEKKDVLIGEQFFIYYRVPLNLSDSIKHIPFEKVIPSYILGGKKDTNEVDVEIIEPFKDSLFKSKNSTEWVGKYKVAIWDSGEVVIPSVTLWVNDSLIRFETIKIKADLIKHIDGKDIYDIKEGFTSFPDEFKNIKSFLKDNWWWILLSIIIVGLIIFIVIRKRKKSKLAAILSIEEIAISKIEELNKKKLWLGNKLKEHYIELSYILREYLSNKLEISFLEKTTIETSLLLKQKDLAKVQIDTIVEVLEKSDMVKFAKSAPDEYEILKTSTLTKEIIQEVHNILSDVE